MGKKRKRNNNLDIYTGEQGYSDYYTSRNLNTSQTQYETVQVHRQGDKLISVSKKGKWLIFLLVVLFAVLVFGGYFIYTQVLGTMGIVTKGDTITKELGDTVTVSRSEFLEEGQMNSFALKQIALDTPLTVDDKYDYDPDTHIVKTKDNECLAVGEYIVRIRLGSQEKVVMLEVVDTTAPKFTGLQDELTVEANAQDLDFKDFFAVSDFDEYTVDIEGKYDLGKEGTYKIEVVAKDASDNENRQPLTLKVLSAKEVSKTKGSTLSKTLDGKTPVSEETEKQIVNGKLSGVENPIGFEKNPISKGTYSNPETQKKVEEEKKRKEQEDKEAKERENNHSNNDNGGNYSNNTGTYNNGGYSNNTQTQTQTQTQKPNIKVGPKPQGDYVDEKGVLHTDLFTTMEGAKKLQDWYLAQGIGCKLGGGFNPKTNEVIQSYDYHMLYIVVPD